MNNLTFSDPLLNTSNTISLKYDNTKLNVDASGNLIVIGGTGQWTTTGTSIFCNTGNIGIGRVAWAGDEYCHVGRRRRGT